MTPNLAQRRIRPLLADYQSGAVLSPGTALNANTIPANLILPLTSTGEPRLFEYPLVDGEPSEDSPQILAYLAGLVDEFKQSAELRQFTTSILSPSYLLDNDLVAVARTICNFVQLHIKYLPDPEDGEYIISPLRMIKDIKLRGATFGDCDDHVLLLNSMLGTVGIATKAVGVRLYSNERYDHVISSILLPKGDTVEWIDFDPCAKGGENPQYNYRIETL